jgi:hypothetical protein
MDTRTAPPPNKQVDQELKGPDYERWRLMVMNNAGYRCQWDEGGERCSVKHPSRLFADHIIERRDGGDLLDPENGQCLCGRHHSLKTARERARRMKSKGEGDGGWWI